MRRFLITAALASLCACGPAQQEAAEADVASAGCAASAETAWAPPGVEAMMVSAATQGATCADARATIIVRAFSSELFSRSFPAAQVMTLAYVDDAPTMQAALAEWIDPAGATLQSSDDLPAWEDGAESPILGEFPFYPAEGIDRAAYAALHARSVPLFCFVQGMESLVCLALENGRLTEIGVQTFPG